MRYRVASHGASEYQKYGGQNSRFYHWKGNPEHGFPFRRIENGGSLFQIGIHVAENAADEDIGKWGVVKPQDNRTGKESLTYPLGRQYSKQGGQQSIGRSHHRIAVK